MQRDLAEIKHEAERLRAAKTSASANAVAH
jgi:hypothetical protein